MPTDSFGLYVYAKKLDDAKQRAVRELLSEYGIEVYYTRSDQPSVTSDAPDGDSADQQRLDAVTDQTSEAVTEPDPAAGSVRGAAGRRET